MKTKYMDKPQYPECEIIGKTTGTVGGTIGRRPVQRALITTDAKAHGKIVVGGDGVVIKAVTAVTEFEVQIELCDGQKSAASWRFFDCYKAEQEEGKDFIEVFTTDADTCDALMNCATLMCDMNPGCAYQWKIVNKGAPSVRVVLRTYDPKVSELGLIA